MTFFVLGCIIAINSPKQNFIKTLASNFFSGNTPVSSVEITTEDYDNEGSIKVTKEAHWVSKTEAELNLKLETIRKTGDNKKDIVLVFDVSASMEGEKLDKVKEDASELINYVLDKDEDNKISIISFASTSRILSPLTNDKNTLLEAVNNMHTEDATNYYLAYKNVETVLDGYSKESGKDLVVLFLTDGVPTINSGATTSIYESLKEEYPYITINAVEYEMGDTTSSVNEISDNQWTAKIDSLNNVLFEATVSPEVYEKLNITDYINDDYFEIENENNNKIEWNFRDNSFITGSDDTLKIKIKLKDEYKDVKGLYPTNTKLDIDYKLSGNTKSKSSTNTPILKNNYDVYYDTNAPEGCTLDEIESENHFIYDNVTKKDTTLSCTGYEFKGWDIEENVTKINDDTFIMPESDVHIRAIWTRQSIAKSMDGNLHEKTTLYKEIASQAEKYDYIKEYTGEHQDSYEGTGTEKIYYYTATTNNGNSSNQLSADILNNFNVIFAGFCWQIIRTTDTGGTKLIYNGIPSDNGTCSNTGTAQQTGNSPFNRDATSPAYVGYMYNKVYTRHTINYSPSISLFGRVLINSNNYYSSQYEYNQSVPNKYKLYDNPSTEKDELFTAEHCIENGNCNEELVGKYTFSSSNKNLSSDRIRYVVGISGEYIYYLEIMYGQTLEDVNTKFYVGDSYEDNSNGTFFINDTIKTTEFKKEDWFKNYNNSVNKYLCVGTNPCEHPVYLTATTLQTYNAESVENNYIYANDFDYILNESTGEYEYTLKDTDISNKMQFWDWHAKNNSINNNHYTCLNNTGKCSKLYYIFYTEKSTAYYFEFINGKGIEDGIEEMFHSENINTINSNAKSYIETWYSNNLIEYSQYLEDTVFCNNRVIKSLGGWNPNGGDTKKILTFYDLSSNKLYCKANTDRFSTLNEKAKLEYPVGLISYPEMSLLNSVPVRKTNSSYWLMSPISYIGEGVSAIVSAIVYHGGIYTGWNAAYNHGIRPSISLKPEIEYTDGDGSKNNPYIIDTSEVDNESSDNEP